jgi:hypothetical protein
MKFTAYESRFDNKGTTLEVPDIKAFLEANRSPAEKDNSALVGLYELKTHFTRSSTGVEQVFALGLDIDSGMSPKKAMELLNGWEAYYFVTHSYTKKHPKFRIIMPLETPLDAYHNDLVWAWVTENLMPENDKATRDPSRMFYLPREGVKIHHKTGDILPLDHVIVKQERLEELREGLRPARQYFGAGFLTSHYHLDSFLYRGLGGFTESMSTQFCLISLPLLPSQLLEWIVRCYQKVGHGCWGLPCTPTYTSLPFHLLQTP